MKSSAIILLAALASGAPMDAAAQSGPDTNSHAQPGAKAPEPEIPVAARPAVAVVEQFGKALAAGDMHTVEALLAVDVLILESGGAERSRVEYMGHHAISDAKFLKGNPQQQLKRRTASLSGDMAWVGSESELHASKNGAPLTLLNTETMVLRKIGADWRITHIHWSSRPKKSK